MIHAPDQVAAVAAAATSDAVVVAVGEKAYAEGLGDHPSPALPADQKALISATSKPPPVPRLNPARTRYKSTP